MLFSYRYTAVPELLYIPHPWGPFDSLIIHPDDAAARALFAPLIGHLDMEIN